MFRQPHFGLPKSPVLVPHQAKNGEQLGLGELMLAETTAIRRQHGGGDFERDACEGQESDLGHHDLLLQDDNIFH